MTNTLRQRPLDVIEGRRPALWLHGHTNDSFDYRVGETRIVCNPRGYGPMRPGCRVETGTVIMLCSPITMQLPVRDSQVPTVPIKRRLSQR